MKKSELREIIREEVRKIMKDTRITELATILTGHFGGYDNTDFLKAIWKMSLPELEDLLEKTTDDLKWSKSHVSGRMLSYYREDEKWIKIRMEWIEDVIESKKENPTYIPKQFQ